MNARCLLAASAAVAAMSLAAVPAGAQQPVSPFGARTPPPRDHGGGFPGGHHKRGFFPGFILVEREVPLIVEREIVVREVPAAPPAPPPEPPRKPYVIGASYASLPGGCMKMIEGSASYYYCGRGEWYRLVGNQFKAVARP